MSVRMSVSVSVSVSVRMSVSVSVSVSVRMSVSVSVSVSVRMSVSVSVSVSVRMSVSVSVSVSVRLSVSVPYLGGDEQVLGGGAVEADLGQPLLGDVVQRGGVRDGETQQEDVRVQVGHHAQPVKLLLDTIRHSGQYTSAVGGQTDRQTDRQIDRQAGRQTGRQTDRYVGR